MSYVIEYHRTGKIDLEALDAAVPNRLRHRGYRVTGGEEPHVEDLGHEIDVRTHGPARRFLAGAEAELDPAAYRDLIAARGALAAFPTRDEWPDHGGIGDLLQRCMEEIQKAVVREGKLLARIEKLEAMMERHHNSL